MKAKLLVVLLSLIIAAACNKDKFGSTPVLTYESINGTTFAQGQNIQIKMRLTDKEGDFDTAGIFMKHYLFYQRFSYRCQVKEDSMSTNNYEIPAFTTNKYLDVDLDLNFTYGVSGEPGQFAQISGCQTSLQDDSTYFRFWILDEAGHVSDTVTTPTFKLLSIN